MLIFFSESCSTTDELAKRADVALSVVGKPIIGEIKKTETGAPYCKNYCLSVTHTDGVSLLALSSTPVGIDIEKKDRIVPESMKDVRNWTAYEAKCKLGGQGIRLSDVRTGGDYTNGVGFHSFVEGYTLAVAGGNDSLFVIVV